MGAASLLALVARQYSLRPVRQHSKLAAAEMVHDIADYEPDERPAGALQPLRSFHVDLAERLRQLQLHGAGNAHLNWLLDALASTLSTHSSLQLALTHVPASIMTSGAASTASLVKHRADEVLSMLDVCTALKQVADDMDRQFGRLQQAVQSVGQALSSDKVPFSGGRLRAAAHRLSACLLQDLPHMTNVLCINSKQYKPLAEARSSLLLAARGELQSPAASDPASTLLSQAVDGAMLTSLLVLASAVSSLAPPSPKKCSATITRACQMIIKYLSAAKGVSAPAWAAPLGQLHRDLRQEDTSATGGALFQELQSLHAAASKLRATIATPRAHSIELTVVKQSAESLRKSLQEAQACVAMFRTQMASFFQALVALRLTLLNCS